VSFPPSPPFTIFLACMLQKISVVRSSDLDIELYRLYHNNTFNYSLSM
jgi:hypothetical protein